MSTFRPIVVNAGWNLLGNLMPMLAGLVAVPFLVHQLGAERFGLLSLGWVLIGYFGLFDFGLGRALTKMVAERWTGGRADAALESLCSTGFALGGCAGVLRGLLVAGVATGGDPRFHGWAGGLRGQTPPALGLVGGGVLPTGGAAGARGL